MQLIRDLNDLDPSLRAGAVTIGNFDGVHRGHARIVQQLIEAAARVSGPSIVFTFDPHPVRLLRPHAEPPPLTWTERKSELLARLDVDAMIAYPTDEALLELSPEAFFQQIVIDALGARAMVEGPNFYFGRNREGDVARLRLLCEAHDVDLMICQPMDHGDEIISSSRVRQLIGNGEVEAASQLLTRPYRVRGMVTHGAGRGARLGFPTANVDAIDTLLPAKGVYAGRAWWQGSPFAAAINIGPNPTFGDQVLKFEAHLIDFHDSIYGEPLEVEILKRVRGVETFPSADDLKAQVVKDVQTVRDIVRDADSVE